MRKMHRMMKGLGLVALGLALASGAVYAQIPPPCNVPDNGTGTVTLPPSGCKYLSADQVHLILKGLPPNTTIILKPIHKDFLCRELGICGTPGGPLGGEDEVFNSTALLQLSGTGALAGWSRTLSLPLSVEVATAPRTPGAPVQTFQTDMLRIQGSIPPGDPDFSSFQIVGGSANGFPSPGSTTLTRQPDGTFNVDSSFNVGYSITFVGAPGSQLQGYGGTTEGTVKMSAQQ
jgi:hypothetical protein